MNVFFLGSLLMVTGIFAAVPEPLLKSSPPEFPSVSIAITELINNAQKIKTSSMSTATPVIPPSFQVLFNLDQLLNKPSGSALSERLTTLMKSITNQVVTDSFNALNQYNTVENLLFSNFSNIKAQNAARNSF